MKNLRKRLIISGIVAALVCSSSAPVDAGVFPWVWNVFFGPADAPWFAPNNGGGYYAGYGPGYYQPACRVRRRRLYRPFAPAFAAPAYPVPAYSVPTPYGGCDTGCASAVSYSPAYSNTLSYSTYVVDSGCNTGCGIVTPAAAPASSQQYETERPEAPASDTDSGTATDEAPETNGGTGAGDDGGSRDGFRTPSSDAGTEEADGFMPPVGGEPDPAPPTEPGASRQSVVPVFASAEGLNGSLSDATTSISSRTLTRDVRSRLAKQRTIRWISAPRNVARR